MYRPQMPSSMGATGGAPVVGSAKLPPRSLERMRAVAAGQKRAAMLRSGLKVVWRSAAVLPLGTILAVASTPTLLVLAGLTAFVVLAVVLVVITPAIWSGKRHLRAVPAHSCHAFGPE